MAHTGDMTNTGTTATVMCDDCNQPHPAEYSHRGDFNQGPVYIVMCGEFASYYLTERLIRTEAKPVKGSKNTSPCQNCGESIERTRYPKRDWYHVGTGTKVCPASS